MRQFTATRNLIQPASIQEQLELLSSRKLDMQYRSHRGSTYFPTEKGWNAFIQFIECLQTAEPFSSKCTLNDTFQATQSAFADMLSNAVRPTEIQDLVTFFPDTFMTGLLYRAERRFSKVQGIKLHTEGFSLIGHCWLGPYRDICFDAIPETDEDHKKHAMKVISDAFDSDTVVMAGDRNDGTTARVEAETSYQWDLALSMICVFLNLSYSWAFHRLWKIRTMDRPEFGISPQRNFSIIEEKQKVESAELSYGMRFVEQEFEIDDHILETWHESIGLKFLNRMVIDRSFRTQELVKCLLDAILYFRQAANQLIPEMQMSTLWICVETIFTSDADKILTKNIDALLHMTAMGLEPEHWPKGATSTGDLRRIFKKYYQYRSRTIHHGRRGHVTERDVQDFSLVVAAVIVGVLHLIFDGVTTRKQITEKLRNSSSI